MAPNHFSSSARWREGEVSFTLALTLTLSPGERGQQWTVADGLGVACDFTADSIFAGEPDDITGPCRYAGDGGEILPLLGERAGERAGVIFSENRS